MSLLTICPRCGRGYRSVPTEFLGRTMQCQGCAENFIIRESALGGPSAIPGGGLLGSRSGGGEAGAQDVPVDWNAGDLIMGMYKVTGVLGIGGMGKVYKVHHRGWNMDLAVKSPKPEILQIPGAAENFTMEAETWVKLGLHPNTCSCYYVRELGGIPRLFAEFVSGGDLEGWIKGKPEKGQAPQLFEGGPEKSLARILDIAIQFAWGLEYAHNQGMIHQDIKPANVMLTPDGVAKVTDFGLARMGAGGSNQVEAAGMSPRWCSPEQASLKKLSTKTDIWSWGISIMPMFTGVINWRRGILAPSVLEGFTARGLRGGDHLPAMPTALAELLKQCFQQDPNDRPENMAIIAETLRAIYRKVVGTPHPRPEPKSGTASAESFNNRAVSFLDLGRLQEADALWQQGLHQHPNHPESTFNQGLSHWRSGAVPEDSLLVERMEESRKSQLHSWLPHYLLGMIHLERGDCNGVFAALRSITPEDAVQDEIRELAAATRHLHPRSRRLLGEFQGHEEKITALRMTPSGQIAVSGSKDATVRVWNLKEQRLLHVMTGHRERIHSVAISDDGRVAISGGDDQTARVWNLKTGKCLRVLKGHVKSVEVVALNPNGHQAFTGGGDNVIKHWDVRTGREVETLQGHSGPVNALAFHAGNRQLVSGAGSRFSSDYTLKLWDVDSGDCLLTMEGHDNPVYAVQITRDGRHALSGSADGTLKLWDLKKGTCLRTLSGHAASINDVGLSHDGRFALSVSGAKFAKDNSMRLWDLETGRCLHTFHDFPGRVAAVACSASGRYALSGGDGNTIQWWQINARRYDWTAPMALSKIQASEKAFSASAAYTRFLDEGQQLLAGDHAAGALAAVQKARAQSGFSRGAEALDLLEQICLRLPRKGFLGGWQDNSWEGHAAPLHVTAFSPDTRLALAGDQGGGITLWNVANGQLARRFRGHNGGVGAACFSQDGHMLLSGGEDNLLHLWDPDTGRKVRTFLGHTLKVRACCLLGNGRYVLSASADETVRLWDAASGRCERIFKGHQGQVMGLDTSLDETRFLSAGEDGLLKLWKIGGNRPIRTFKGHRGQVFSVEFSRDGQFAFSASSDGTLVLWNVDSGKPLRVFSGHNGFVRSGCLSGDGRYALSGGDDNLVRLWDVDSGACLRAFAGHANPVHAVTFSHSGRYALSGGADHVLKLWAMDWDLVPRQSADWDPAALPYVQAFRHRRAKGLKPGPLPLQQRLRRLLAGASQGMMTDKEIKALIQTLGRGGLGWLRQEGVRERLNAMEGGLFAKIKTLPTANNPASPPVEKNPASQPKKPADGE